MPVIARLSETSTSTGTGDFTLAGAEIGAATLASDPALSSLPSDNFTYAIEEIDANGNASGAWEVGIGRLTAGGALDRTTSGIGLAVLRSSNSNARVSFAAGSKRVYVTTNGTDVQTFIAGGAFTWYRPAWAETVRVIMIGAGASGGAGRKGASGTAWGGGGGGGGGAFTVVELAASAVGSTESVTVGTGGAAVAGQATNSTNGPNGNAGGATLFGSWARANGGSGGGGGGAAGGTLGNGGTISQWAGANGGAGGLGGCWQWRCPERAGL